MCFLWRLIYSRVSLCQMHQNLERFSEDSWLDRHEEHNFSLFCFHFIPLQCFDVWLFQKDFGVSCDGLYKPFVPFAFPTSFHSHSAKREGKNTNSSYVWLRDLILNENFYEFPRQLYKIDWLILRTTFCFGTFHPNITWLQIWICGLGIFSPPLDK